MSNLPSMPIRALQMQHAYLDLKRTVKRAIESHNTTWEAALMLAFVGEQTLIPKIILERGYYIGSNTSHILKNLEAGGYIRRVVGKDRRRLAVFLTPKGLALAAEIRHSLSQDLEWEAA